MIDSGERFRFRDFELDVPGYELRRQGRPVRLERQPMDLLILLVQRRRHLVSRTDIVERLWSKDVFIDVETGVNTAVSKIRQALGDSRESPRFVETVPGKGYRFVAPVEVVAQSPFQASPAPVAAPERLPDTRRHNLPAEFTSFVGRRKELLKLPGMLASSRLLSLTGAGGVGKTRLALRLASGLVNEFPGGVWLVDLAPLTVPDLVAQTIATALGVREGPQRSAREALLDGLRDAPARAG
jgi:DNA-binding winged helix-turn-helix (wHTH) protein